MNPLRVALNTAFLFLVFIIQESVVTRVRLPIAGFSLYIAILLAMISLEERNGAVALGFIGGLVLDLSPTSDGPFGQWALILTLTGYLISLNRDSVAEFIEGHVGFGIFIGIAASGAFVLYLLFGTLLGESNGNIWRATVIILGNFLYTVIFSPFFLPPLRWMRELMLTSRERS